MSVLADDDLIEVHINGLQVGQQIKNVMHYTFNQGAAGDILLSDVCLRVRLWWRTHFLALMSDSYSVISYVAKRVGSLIGPANQPRVRFNAYNELVGVDVDDDGGLAGAFLPTYVGISGRKVTNGPATTGYMVGPPAASVVNSEKFFRGGIRVGGIMEVDTEEAQGNDLTDAAATAWQAALDELRIVDMLSVGSLGTGTLDMCVMSVMHDGMARHVLGQPADVFTAAMQPVTAIALNPYVGSQLTRKQRPGGA